MNVSIHLPYVLYITIKMNYFLFPICLTHPIIWNPNNANKDPLNYSRSHPVWTHGKVTGGCYGNPVYNAWYAYLMVLPVYWLLNDRLKTFTPLMHFT